MFSATTATADSSVELPSGTPTSTESVGSESQSTPQSQSGGSALFTESTFLSGQELEETIENIKTMGFSEDMIRKALQLSYFNPDRAVEMLVTVSESKVKYHNCAFYIEIHINEYKKGVLSSRNSS